eukprot:TRINITY_DN1693_c0_g1_i3.p1 TRINITY_DN1693_c0_g1~~TRINITY_DN1693_c0_g1_i3.p1  ORF type:complete len:277 (-),score=36.83 TRINITY_DN1693_c0_g1_i3:29-859(-)
MAIAAQVLDDILRTEFGFEHILYVFSGRRGIHAWICDERARKLSAYERKCIGEFLGVVSETTGQSNKFSLEQNLHPTFRRVYDNILATSFEQFVILEQGLFDNPHHVQNILSFVPIPAVKDSIQKAWETISDPIEKWNIYKEIVNERIMQLHNPQYRTVKMANPIHSVIFTYLYPRLDIEVTRQTHHLLKSPFACHPSTGRVCVPLDITTVFEFNPETVPTIDSLANEINSASSEVPDLEIHSIEDQKKFSLMKTQLYKGGYIDLFEGFVNNMTSQ